MDPASRGGLLMCASVVEPGHRPPSRDPVSSSSSHAPVGRASGWAGVGGGGPGFGGGGFRLEASKGDPVWGRFPTVHLVTALWAITGALLDLGTHDERYGARHANAPYRLAGGPGAVFTLLGRAAGLAPAEVRTAGASPAARHTTTKRAVTHNSDHGDPNTHH